MAPSNRPPTKANATIYVFQGFIATADAALHGVFDKVVKDYRASYILLVMHLKAYKVTYKIGLIRIHPHQT